MRCSRGRNQNEGQVTYVLSAIALPPLWGQAVPAFVRRSVMTRLTAFPKIACAVLIGSLALAGCARQISPDVHSGRSVGDTIRTYPATIETARLVEIQENDTLESNKTGQFLGAIGWRCCRRALWRWCGTRIGQPGRRDHRQLCRCVRRTRNQTPACSRIHRPNGYGRVFDGCAGAPAQIAGRATRVCSRRHLWPRTPGCRELNAQRPKSPGMLKTAPAIGWRNGACCSQPGVNDLRIQHYPELSS